MTRSAGADASALPADELTALVLDAVTGAGVDVAGIARAEPFDGTRRDLHERRAAGLHGGMAFTYKNPERSTDPGRIVCEAASLVVGARSYLRMPPASDRRAGMVAAGRVARYAWEDSYLLLRAGLEVGAEALRTRGYVARVVADSNALVDREAARRAGLGWYGRNANLLLPGRGSWFVLGSIVTDAELIESTPVEPGCGACTRCIDGCPTEAIVAPGVVDARRCLAWLVQAPGVIPWEFRVALGDRMYGCDDCQEVCPPNQVVQRRPIPIGGEDCQPVVDVVEFLGDDDDAVLAAAGAWYVQARDARYLRRNALIVLGNAGDPTDPRVPALVQCSLESSDPLVRGHAVWAAARLGLTELAESVTATEADPMVLDELRRAPDVPRRPV